jgi:hypothetical protein
MAVNFEFRNRLLARWETLGDAARTLGIDQPAISAFVRYRRLPNASQREKLLKFFSANEVAKMFSKKPPTCPVCGSTNEESTQ